MQRFSGASPVASPHPSYPKSSPLAKVTEEGHQPMKVITNGILSTNINGKLVEVPTPVTPHVDADGKKSKLLDSLLTPVTSNDDKENKNIGDMNIKRSSPVDSKISSMDDETMKTIEI